MFAVIRTGGKQYKVSEGEILDVELLDATDSKISISDVLLVGNGTDIKIGKPALAPKVVAYKYRRREGYHRTVGHRQKLSRVKVTGIAL